MDKIPSSFSSVGLIWAIILLVTVLFIFNNYSGLDNVSPAAAQQQATTGSIPVDREAQNFVESLDEIDMDGDLMSAGINFNINTTAPNAKNKNMQLRPDPIVTQVDTGYFNQSVIMPDLNAKNIFA